MWWTVGNAIGMFLTVVAMFGVAGLLDWQQMKREAKREAERQARARSRQRWGSATSACLRSELEAMKRRY